jgi:hypothetical protein
MWRGLWLLVCLLLAPLAGATEWARQNYLLYCSGCHLPDGRGSAVNDVPSLHGIPGQFIKVPRGRAFLAQVPGILYSPLTDAEAAEIINWMLAEYSSELLPADFKPYTPQEVALHRRVRPANIMKLRAEILAELAALGVTVDYRAQ